MTRHSNQIDTVHARTSTVGVVSMWPNASTVDVVAVATAVSAVAARPPPTSGPTAAPVITIKDATIAVMARKPNNVSPNTSWDSQPSMGVIGG